MKRLAFHALLACFVFAVGLPLLDALLLTPRASTDVVVLVTPFADTVHVGELVPLKVTLTNNGPRFITLVFPGDGSDSGWRTPVIAWSVTASGTPERRKALAPSGRSCGNINALEWGEVFRLQSGDSVELGEWTSLYAPEKPGAFTVRFYYANRPTLEWQGIPLGAHNPFAMWRVRHSTECSIASNEVYLTVLE